MGSTENSAVGWFRYHLERRQWRRVMDKCQRAYEDKFLSDARWSFNRVSIKDAAML